MGWKLKEQINIMCKSRTFKPPISKIKCHPGVGIHRFQLSEMVLSRFVLRYETFTSRTTDCRQLVRSAGVRSVWNCSELGEGSKVTSRQRVVGLAEKHKHDRQQHAATHTSAGEGMYCSNIHSQRYSLRYRHAYCTHTTTQYKRLNNCVIKYFIIQLALWTRCQHFACACVQQPRYSSVCNTCTAEVFRTAIIYLSVIIHLFVNEKLSSSIRRGASERRKQALKMNLGASFKKK